MYVIHNAGVPSGSVFGTVSYTIFPSDMPTLEAVVVATYADDTAFITCSEYEYIVEASSLLQNQPDILQFWIDKCRVKVNSEKSTHDTCT